MEFPWILAPAVINMRTIIHVLFVATAGALQGRKSGRWPTLEEWCIALRFVSPDGRFGAQNERTAKANGRARDEGE
jgi:hypothetical protein